jgi:hypothetical protein
MILILILILIRLVGGTQKLVSIFLFVYVAADISSFGGRGFVLNIAGRHEEVKKISGYQPQRRKQGMTRVGRGIILVTTITTTMTILAVAVVVTAAARPSNVFTYQNHRRMFRIYYEHKTTHHHHHHHRLINVQAAATTNKNYNWIQQNKNSNNDKIIMHQF